MTTKQPPILLVLPFAAYDHKIALDVLEWIGELEPVQDRPILLVPATDVGPQTRAKAEELAQRAFKRIYTWTPKLLPEETGWPRGANATFAAVVNYLYRAPNAAPFYFFEPDNTPTRAGWLKEFDAAYYAASKPFMGYLEDSYRRRANGEVYVSGKHLVGTAVYSRRLPEYTTAYQYCTKLAFDVAIENYVVPHSAHTPLIQHNWLTENYRWEGEEIVCDARDGRIPGQKEFAKAKPYDRVAAVVHGAKDGSLIRALREGRQGIARAVEEAAPVQGDRESCVAASPPPAPEPPRRKRGRPMKPKRGWSATPAV